MIDDLGLEHDDAPRHRRHRRRGADDRSGGAARTGVVLVVVAVMLAALGGAAWWGLDRVVGFFSAPDYTGGGTNAVSVQVRPGETAVDIARTLAQADVVKSEKSFVNAASDNALSRNIQPGFYELRRQMRAKDALALLIDPVNRIVKGVTIPEGRTVKQTYKLLSEATKIPVKDFESAGKDPVALGVPKFWFNRSDEVKAKPSLEGFLFPQTYEFDPDADATAILKTMVQQFLTEAEEIDFVAQVEAGRGGITPYEALVVASLSQAEAGVPEDLGKVARVAYNRVYAGDFPCGCLEMDVTVNYWLEATGKPTKASKDMTAAELDDPKNPYNRKRRGLVPGPINNPGQEALKGAMAPPVGDWLFFVAIDKEGHSAFATTLAEHEKNIATARKNGVL
ncbi:endolytic transglycosylase MltG [Pilimelia columellifera]|uniref:Endolytic murein transglycosylase n=1 Tax=Pilimelia columellifera subsp. columellifera TaxID=706583 RepID=A0ABP6AYJ8_9ACTN